MTIFEIFEISTNRLKIKKYAKKYIVLTIIIFFTYLQKII